jgi:hypothetical protein
MVGFVPLLVLALPSMAPAATRYVSLTGSDNLTCAQATPCRTIINAVTIAAAGDTIQIGKGLFVESLGVAIGKNLVLKGAGSFSTVVKGEFGSVFTIQSSANVEINSLMIRHGTAIRGGGIHNDGILSLNFVRIWQNQATESGGGIFNATNAALHMFSCEILNNDGGSFAGGLHNRGSANLTVTRFVNNHAGFAGGIWNDVNATLYLLQALVRGHAQNGIYNTGDATVTNATLANNRPYAVETAPIGRFVLTHSTIVDNGSHNSGAGLVIGGEVRIRNTLLANAHVNCVFTEDSTLAEGTGNLDSDDSCTFFPWNNVVGVDPKIGPLKANGSFLDTYALLTGSPAIDAADQAWCELTDQRGVLRIIDGNGDGTPACDIGAFEYSPFRRIDQ